MQETEFPKSIEPLLTKSRYMAGLQCPVYLWYLFHAPDKIPETGEAQQFIFDQGSLVGNYAKKLWPDGIDLKTDDFKKNLQESKRSLSLRRTLFEAAFVFGRIYSRADILEPAEDSCWNLIEVKSSTSVKNEHVLDVSFQKYCYEKAGLKIKKTYLMHLNKNYIRRGSINLNNLFVKEDITDKVNNEIKKVPENVKKMLEIIDSKKKPSFEIGLFCNEPYDCPLKNDCWSFLPERNIFDLYRGGKIAYQLFKSGILEIKEIPTSFSLNAQQRIQYNCEKNNKPHVNKKEIENFLGRIEYPIYFLDFETYRTAIPLYDGLKPYQQVPFQFSLHVLDCEKSKVKHFSYIAEGKEDPRKDFLENLKKVVGKEGSVVVYNQRFEQGILTELAEHMPLYKDWIDSIVNRMIDLLTPFREFYYYHPDQKGSASIKKVLPAIAGKSYDELEITDGEIASLRYLYITHGSIEGKCASSEEIKKTREDLKKYCELDTKAMLLILNKLKEIVNSEK